MDDDFSVVLAMLAAAAISGLFFAGLTTDAWRRDTIERGLAVYCPNNGAWAWKGECDAD